MTERFSVRALTQSDLPAMLRVCQSNPLYYEHFGVAPTTKNLAADLTALPPGKTAADKHFLGFFDGETLAAIADLITGYPDAKTLYIGLFMLDAAYQGRGLGSRLAGRILSGAAQGGFSRARLAYVKTNPQSAAFWRKNGFLPTGQEADCGGCRVVVLEKAL